MPFEDAVGAPLQDGRETMMRSRPLSRDVPADGIPGMVYADPEQGWLLLSALATVAAMPQGVRTPPSLELLDWAFPTGFAIAQSSGMDRRSKRDSLLRVMEWAKLANPESAAPETMARRRSSLLRGFMRSAAASCVSDRSRMAETRPWAWFRRSRERGPKGNAQTDTPMQSNHTC